MKKFSLLVALYNGERFLPRLLDSLLSQDIPYEEYELVFIDDCSPDNSSEVVRGYQTKYPNIRLYKNEKNCRIATNLNRLVGLAEGKYFWMIGQDDFIKPNCLGHLWERLEKDSLDVLLFNYRDVNEQEKEIKLCDVFSDTECMSGVGWIKNQFATRDYRLYLLGYEWRAVYKTDYWREKGIRCVDGLNWEDTVIMMKAIVYSRRVASIIDVLYNYRHNAGSISYSANHVKRGNYIFEFAFQVGDEVEQFYYELKKMDEELASDLLVHVRKRYNSYAFDLVRTSKDEKKKFYVERKRQKSLVAEKKKWIKLRNRLLLWPIFGYPISRVCEWLYRLKKNVIG